MNKAKVILIVREKPNDLKSILLGSGYSEDDILMLSDSMMFEVYAKIIEHYLGQR